jgi:hypothetical protein
VEVRLQYNQNGLPRSRNKSEQEPGLAEHEMAQPCSDLHVESLYEGSKEKLEKVNKSLVTAAGSALKREF